MEDTLRTEKEPIRVIYIVGCGRSGSTVLDMMLGNHADVTGVGELCMIRGAFRNKRYCSCQHDVLECDFWSAVGEDWNSRPAMSVGDYDRLQKKYERFRACGGISWTAYLKNRAVPSAEFRRFLDQTYELYSSISKASGNKIIVDSSKAPLRAALLAQTPGIDLRLVHLVRDSRGVAWSRMKSLKSNAQAGVFRDSSGKGVSYSSLYWMLVNGISDWNRRSNLNRSMLLRYEDLVTKPGEAVERISELSDTDFTPVIGKIERGESIGTGHIFSGNRLRMESQIRLKPDTEWQTAMSSKDQDLTALLTRFLLKKYGYGAKPDQIESAEELPTKKAA